MMKSERRINRLKTVLAQRQPDLTVVIENVHDPHNVSAMLRTCDATGVMCVSMIYTIEKSPKIGKKSSASAFKWIERRTFKSVDECYKQLHEESFTIYATHLNGDSASLYDLDLTKKVALVFGNEHRGVSEEAARKADGNFQIPMFGMIQSLNVSVACAVCLYEAMRQRLMWGSFKKPKFDDQTSEKLLSEWLKK
jgi:tRNA (guanosine-2'-O-)-methyltransferase